jgi:hypothetical protein
LAITRVASIAGGAAKKHISNTAMFFRKKVSVDDYCTMNLMPLLSTEHEATWEAMRRACNNTALSAVPAQLYYDHLRAVFIELLLIAVAQSSSMDTSLDAHAFVMMYLNEHNQSTINEISRGYSHAFASSDTDGVAEMVAHFSAVLAGGTLQPAATEQLYVEFYSVLKIFFNDFSSIKLVPSS